MSKLSRDHGSPRALLETLPPMHCQVCSVGHQTRAAHRGTLSRAPTGHTLCADKAGMLPKTSIGHQYFLTEADHNTRFKLVYLLRTKGEAGPHIMSAVEKVVRHFGTLSARLRTNNANELLTKLLGKVAAARGIHLDALQRINNRKMRWQSEPIAR